MVARSDFCTNRTSLNLRVVSSSSSKHMIKHSVRSHTSWCWCQISAHRCASVCVIIVHTVSLTSNRAATHQDTVFAFLMQGPIMHMSMLLGQAFSNQGAQQRCLHHFDPPSDLPRFLAYITCLSESKSFGLYTWMDLWLGKDWMSFTYSHPPTSQN